jgi:hypothetical protein
MLKLLVSDNGCVELTEIHRFVGNDWEADASVRLRAGDTDVLDLYEANGRLVGGTEEVLTDKATRGWLADTFDGKQSLLVTASNRQARELSAEIRTELVRLGRVSPEVIATGRDGNLIGVGDWIQARQNDSTIRVDGAGRVTNRVSYEVLGESRWSGHLRVRSETGLIAHLPPDYVANHTTLAYASTVHAAQGRTVDTCHSLIDLTTDRRSAYVALTRGRESNTAYVVCEREPDAHQPDRVSSTARAQMEDVLGRTDAPGTAAAELSRRAGETEGGELGWIGSQWDQVTQDEAKHRYTCSLAELLDPPMMDTLVAEPGYDRLLRATRAAELAGHDSEVLLGEVVAARSLIGADSMSDVLRWRIRGTAEHRTPERQVATGDWSALSKASPGPVGDYVEVLARAAETRQVELGQLAGAQRPEWAVERLGEPPTQQRELDEWVRRAGVVGAYRELRGVPAESVSIGPAPAREQVFHRTLWQHAYAALGAPTDELDYAMASDTELRQMRDDYRREATWAPYRVQEELRDARLVATGYRQDAVLWRAEAEQLPAQSPERAIAEADVAAAEELAGRYDARVEHLVVIAERRDQWHQDTEEVRTRHVRAGEELTRRGLAADPGAEVGEQAALFEVIEPEDEQPERTCGPRTERQGVDTDQLPLELDLRDGAELGRDDEADEPVTVTRAPAPVEPGPRAPRRPSATAQTRQEIEEALAAEHGQVHDVDAPGPETDPDQGELFPARARAEDVAAAQPLRETAAPITDPDNSPVSVGQARRQAEISSELRAERERWIGVLEPAHAWAADRDDTAAESLAAHQRRAEADVHDRQLQRVLGREQAQDLDEDIGLGL